MRRAFFIFTACIILSAAIFGQPGDDGTLSVNIVDSNRKPVRGAYVKSAGPGEGKSRAFLGRIFPTVVEAGDHPLFQPRDAEFSGFIATIRCRHSASYSIKVTAPGYETLIYDGRLRGCADEITVMLKRTAEPLPQLDPLCLLSGKLADQNRRPMSHRFRIIQGRHTFVPLIGADGSYSVKLTAGLYEIAFSPYNCSEYNIKNYRIYDKPRTLDITVDCPSE